MKKYITFGILIFSTLFGWLGALLSGGSWFSVASILLGFVGCFFGIWAGYTFYKAYIE